MSDGKERVAVTNFSQLPRAGQDRVIEAEHDGVVYELPIRLLSRYEWEQVALDEDIPPTEVPLLHMRGGNIPNENDKGYRLKEDWRIMTIHMRRLVKASTAQFEGRGYREQAENIMKAHPPGVLDSLYAALAGAHWEGTAQVRTKPRPFLEAGDIPSAGNEGDEADA